MLSRIGIGELLVLLFIVLLIFGPRRLPDLAGSIAKSIKSFKDGLKDDNGDDKKGGGSKPS
jgi:sec-independent protein translocase protein TatA